MSEPLLSVVIATVNNSEACNLTTASIISQLEYDEIPYEIILLDNNSTEEEKKLLEQFLRFHKDYPIKFYNYDILGTIPIFSFGVTQAKGKYIAMAEPHLIFAPHYYKTMIESYEALNFSFGKNIKMLYSPFMTGSVGRKNDDYIFEHDIGRNNPLGPFGRMSGLGLGGKLGEEPKSIFGNIFCGMVCEKEWLLKIGNMFPEAFKEFGGYIAESFVFCLSTWLMGGECWIEPKVAIHHPVYRISKGVGRSERMFESMALAAYIFGGEKYMLGMPKQWGAYGEETFEKCRKYGKEPREFLLKNAKYTLDEFCEKWPTIKEAGKEEIKNV